MSLTNDLRIAVFDGDGIGKEITEPCLMLMNKALNRVGGISASFTTLPAGADHYAATGNALPQASLDEAGKSDAILLSCMGDPAVRYPDGTEITPQIDLRFHFDLYAGVRPVRSVPGYPGPLADPRGQQLNFVLIRESTEGLFASMKKGVVTEDEARDTQVITRAGCKRVFDYAFKLARIRKKHGQEGRVTCIDKANVFRSFAFFREVFDECAAAFPDIAHDHGYVDAMALNFVKRPWDYDVMVTENMFGDILSDLGAGLMGGLGMAPSADVGDRHAVFQPCHGTAPDIAGQGRANPTAMFLSGAMMLDWLGTEHGEVSLVKAGSLLTRAVDTAFGSGGLQTFELGGGHGTTEVTAAVANAIDTLDI